jgi:hypothetical protein
MWCATDGLCLEEEEYLEATPQISPDGRWMAYSVNESPGEMSEIYVRPFPDIDTGKWQVSQSGGDAPLWSPDGRELFYFGRDGIMAVPVETEPTFNAEKPRLLIKGNYVLPSMIEFTPWDIHPIDSRFLMMKPVPSAEKSTQAPAPSKIIVVINWFEELNKRVPVD